MEKKDEIEQVEEWIETIINYHKRKEQIQQDKNKEKENKIFYKKLNI